MNSNSVKLLKVFLTSVIAILLYSILHTYYKEYLIQKYQMYCNVLYCIHSGGFIVIHYFAEWGKSDYFQFSFCVSFFVVVVVFFSKISR